MATKLDSVVIDALDPLRLARFWSAALGFPVTFEEPDEVAIEPPAGSPGLRLLFEPVSDPKASQNRVHLDLGSPSLDEQRATVSRLEALGAQQVDIGQKGVPWVVLADPEGNEFCVLEPRDEYRETGPLAAVVIEASDPRSLAAFWAEATGWSVNELPDGYASLQAPGIEAPFVEFIAATAPKRGKNRLHIDVAPPPGGDQRAEIERLEALGARPVDIGQGKVSWVVLVDPEGNEFCVLTPR